MNPFTQDHHGLIKEAYGGINVSSPAAETYYGKSGTPAAAPSPTVSPTGFAYQTQARPRNLRGAAQRVREDFKASTSGILGNEYANQMNTLTNNMNLWERLRLIFSQGMSWLLDKFGVKHNFNNRLDALKRQAGVNTIQKTMGIEIAPENVDRYLGTAEEWRDPAARLQFLYQPGSRFYNAYEPRFKATTDAVRQTVIDETPSKWYNPASWLPSARRFDTQMQQDPARYKDLVQGAWDVGEGSTSLYDRSAPDTQLIFDYNYLQNPGSKIESTGFGSSLLDAHKKVTPPSYNYGS